MSLIPYKSIGSVARLASTPLSTLAITPSSLVKAASLLRPVAQLLWQNRESLGEAAVAAKRVVGSLINRSKPAKRKKGRVINNSSSGPQYNSVATPFSSSMVLSNASFLRTYQNSDGDGCRVIGTMIIGTACRFGSTGAANNFCISTSTYGATSTTGKVSNCARLLNPHYLAPASDINWGFDRLTAVADLYSLFRFVHLHLRYVPSLNITNTNQQSLSVGYNSDPLGLDAYTFSETAGSNILTSQIMARTDASAFFPAWAPADLELNWAGGDFYYCDPQGAGYPDLYSQTADEAELRQACQGILSFGVSTKTTSPAVEFGTWVIDYVVDFKGMTQFGLPEPVSGLTFQEKKDLQALIATGWRPEHLATPTPNPAPARAPPRRS